jgi:hypothetical protein
LPSVEVKAVTSQPQALANFRVVRGSEEPLPKLAAVPAKLVEDQRGARVEDWAVSGKFRVP